MINNYGQFCHLIFRTLRDLGVDVSLVENTLSVDEIFEMEPAGIVLSGGPDINRIGKCQDYVKDIDTPILGICLGHQLMAAVFGGEIGKGRLGGYSKVIVEIVKKGPLFEGLGDRMVTWASHADAILSLPEQFELLGTSDICDIEAMSHKEKPLYGVQFHPEVSHTKGGVRLFENFIRICKDRL